VVNAAGMWGRQVGAMAGVDVPLQAAEHYYLVTEPIDGVHRDLPVMEDPDAYGYYREETGGLLVGLFEPQAAPWNLGGIPAEFAFGEIEPDWDRIAPFVDRAMDRIPVVRSAGVRKFFCGPESFTSDALPLLGESPEVRNFFVACGLNSVGILLGGGVGHVMADWIVNGRPAFDMTGLTADRAMPFEVTPAFRRDRIPEVLGILFGDAVAPGWSPRTARNVRRSPVHERLVAHGAHFNTSSGWEWAEFFAGAGAPAPKVERTWRRQPHFALIEAEHRAVRERVGLLDMSFMCKFLVQGRDATAVLNALMVSEMDVPVGRVIYSAILNSGGGMELDCTVTRLAEDRYMVIGTDWVQRRLEALLRRGLGSRPATVTDVTSGWALFSVQGPASRQLLAGLTSADLSHDAFAYLSGRRIDLGYVPVWAQRVTYVGELGFELHVPSEYSRTVYDALFDAGPDLGLRNVGMSALDGLRIEKGYRDYGHDIGGTDTPLEIGVGFMVAWDKSSFPGREALLAQKAAGVLPSRFVNVLVRDPGPLLYHGEGLWRDGELVGDIQAGAYGYTLGGAVGIGSVDRAAGVSRDWIDSGTWEVHIVDRRYPAQVQLGPLYDPDRTRILS